MLTQSDADALIAMVKTFAKPVEINLTPGLDESYELIGADKREHFVLDVWRGTIRLSKIKYQTRGRTVVVLVRLDIDGSPHTNPDGTSVGRSPLHLYREGYDDKWAYPLDPVEFANPADLTRAFDDFCHLCNIHDGAILQGVLL